MSQQEMVNLLESLVPEEGVIDSWIDQVRLFHITNAAPRTPTLYEPSIIILVQGKKRIYIGDEIYTYDPLNYLVLSVPLPIECETIASPDKPMLGLTVNVNPSIVGEIVLEMDNSLGKVKSLPKGVYSAPLSKNMTSVILRLLNALSSQKDSRILGPMIVRELIYRVLSEEKTGALRSLAHRDRHFYQIARALNKIHESYNEISSLNSLATDAGMSISTFHSAFRAVTSTSPLQYIKNIRLHKARMLMIEKGEYAYEAALRVGYESISQFSREYKRLFGAPPGRDVAKA